MIRNLLAFYFGLAFIFSLLFGCASVPAKRAEYIGLPLLENGFSRMYVSAGCYSPMYRGSARQNTEDCDGGNLNLRYARHPVFLNNQSVGAIAEDEYIVIDLLPGTYEAYCTPEKPDKNYIEKGQIIFKAEENRYFSCEMAQKTVAGMAFGLVGALLTEYFTETYFEERSIKPNGKPVSYKKLQ